MTVTFHGSHYSGVSGDTKPTLTSTDAGALFAETNTDQLHVWNGSGWDAALATSTMTLTNKTLTAPDINGGTVDAITSLTVANNVDVGNYTVRASNFLADSHTAGRVLYTGTDGVLSSEADLAYNASTDTLTATNIAAFNLTGKLTAGSTEIEGSAFDIDGGDMTGVTISGALTWSAAQNLNSQALTNVNVDTGDIASAVVINKSPAITLGGDLSGSLTLTNLAGGTLTATIAADSVALGTDTTGNYIATVAGTTNEIDVSGSGSEGGAVTVGIVSNPTLTGNVTVTGNLEVQGDTVTLSTSTITIEDTMLYLANSNSADSVDIGFYGKYVDSGTKYSGFFRDASDSDKWKLFATTGNSHAAPTSTVNTTSGFTLGTLVADTFEGNLTGNASGTAATWATARTLSFTGDVTGSGSVNGGADVATDLTIGNAKIDFVMLADDIFTGAGTAFTSVDPAADYLLLYDSSGTAIKRVIPNELGVSGLAVGGSNSIQYANGTAFAGATNAEIKNTTLALAEMATPNAVAGYGLLYAKSDNELYYRNDTNSEVKLTNAGSIAGGGAFRGTKLKLTNANNSISNNSATTPTAWSEIYDVGAIHDVSSNTDRITFGLAGYYQIQINQEWQADAAGYREMTVTREDVSGTTNDGVVLRDRIVAPTSQTTAVSGGSTIIYVDDGSDYVTVQLYQNSGAALNAIGSTDGGTFIVVTRIDMATSFSQAAGGAGYLQLSDGSGGFTYDNGQLFFDTSNNRLGIGTASPSTTLQVSGTVTATAFSGPIDGILGGNTPAAITGTTISASSSVTVGDTVITNGVITDSTGLSLVANVTVTGNMLPAADDTYDIGSSAAAWQDLFLEGDITLTDAGTLKTSAGVLTIDGDDGIVLNTTGSGDVTISENLVVNGTVTGTGIKDEDTMSSDSATHVATQQSIKAYVDAQITTEDTLAELNDTNITSPADASFLIYDTGTSTWRDYELTGDISVSDAGAVTIAANSVALATDTTGNYVAAITAGTGLTSTGATTGENISHSLSVDESQTQITAVGTLTTGTWEASTIAVNKGGTGQTTANAFGATITTLGAQTANLNMNSNTVYNVSQLSGSHTDGPRIAGNEASSDTNPTFIVDRQDMTTGIGGTSTYVSSIVAGTERIRATTSGATVTGSVTIAETVLIGSALSSANATLGINDSVSYGTTNTVAHQTYQGTITQTSTGRMGAVDIQTNLTHSTGGTVPLAFGLRVLAPTLTVSAGAVTASASLYISGAMSNAGTNYAVWVDAGTTRLDGDLHLGIAGGTYTNLTSAGAITGHGTNISLSRSGSGAVTVSDDISLVPHSSGTVIISSAGEATLILTSDSDANSGDTDAIIRFKKDNSNTTIFSTRYDQGNDSYTISDTNGVGWYFKTGGSAGLGVAADANYTAHVSRTFTATGFASQFRVSGSLTGVANQPLNVISMGSNTLVKASSGTHAIIAGLALYNPTITSGSASSPVSATLYIDDAMTGATANHALFVDAGTSRFDGNVGIGTGSGGIDHELHVENSASNSTPAIKLENDAQGYRLQVNGGDSDKFQLLETTGFDSFLQFAPSTKDVTLGVDNNIVNLKGHIYIDNYLQMSTANAGASNKIHVNNSHEDAGSDATIEVYVNGRNSSDAGLLFATTYSTNVYWKLGIDQSNSKHFKISNNGQFGTNDYFTIDTSGNIGIGPTSPAAPLEIARASADTNSFLTESSDSGQGPTMMVRRARGSSLSSPTAIQSGNWMGKFTFAGHDGGGYDEGPMIRAATSETWSSTAHGSYLSFWTVDNTTTTQDERMRIIHDGKVGIGNTSPSEQLTVTGNILATGDVTAYSDMRLKENIVPITSALDKVSQMKGVNYNFIESGELGVGVLAQDLEKVAPELVHEGPYKSVAYGNLTAYLVEAIKELKREIIELKKDS